MILKKNDLNNINHFLQDNINIFFLYGENFGLMHYLSDLIYKKYNISDKKIILSNELAKQPSFFYNAFHGNDFFEKKNICVKILDYNTKCFKNVESIINSLSCSKKIIIVSDSLDLKDLINKITKENFILTIPCYFDEINDKIKTIKDFLKINDISSTDEFIENFAKLINGDRMVLMQELEKVNVYFLNSNNKTLDKNYLENIYDNSFSTSDEIIDQIMLQDYEIFKNLEKILSYNIDFFPFLLSFERHLNLIYLKLCKIKFENSNIENELKYVFFKRLNKIKYQLEKLSIKKINSIAKRISKIQHDFLIYGENFAIIEFKKFLFDYYKK